MKGFKAQSAMEYLMTYGWAILIIAVVLGALFSLGVFSGSSLIGTACIAQSGYYCQNLVYHGGNLILTFGQATGTNWGQTYITFVPSGYAYKSYNTIYSPALSISSYNSLGTSFSSGQTATVTIPITSPPGPAIGTPLTGYLYVNYTISGTSYVAQVATVSVKAS
ncbi:MAG: hypothetical protein QXV17_06320 [Candidatus Micrarchaeaceae archaeon]